MSGYIKILVVEDEKIVALDLKRRLTKLGYEVTGTASSGDKALTLVSQELPNIILMDIHIQGRIDGIEVAAMLQRIHSIPIIYLTAYSEEKTLARAKTTKPYGYLLKPFSDRELHIIIQVSLERYHSDMLLKKNEQHFRLALEAAQLNTWEITEDSQEIFMGKSPAGDLQPLSGWTDFYRSVDEHDKPKVSGFIHRLRNQINTIGEIEFRVNAAVGKVHWYKLYGKSFTNSDLEKNHIVGVLQHTTENRLVKDRLAQAATVFEYASEGIIILNENKKFDCANNAFYKITGFQHDDLKAQELPFLTQRSLHSEDENKIWQACDEYGHWQGEIIVFKKNGEKIYTWLNIGVIPADSGIEQRFVVMLSDITIIRKTEEQLSRIAYYDSLTNLPNRMLIMDRLNQALAKAVRESSLLGVLFIDLDNFKRVNDTLGHKNGDTLLCFVARRMYSVLRQSDTLGRLSGDEFIVIVSNAESYESLVKVAEKILESVCSVVIIDNMEILPSCSIGISVHPDHSAHPDELVQMADTAMYEAKNKGRNSYAFYHPSLTQKAAHHLTRERELYRALERNEFILYYQPQFSPIKKKITCVEALIRWQHPTRGLLASSEIIPVAETSRLIIEIGNWVLTQACKQLSLWQATGLCDLRVAVNISIRQLAGMQLQKLIPDLLQQYSLPAHLLELEVTESCLQNDLTYIHCLEQLENLGVLISIDDFGTGYSCLSSLKNLPIHRLKIDQSFITGIPRDDNDCAIASAIVVLAQKLKMQVIAEGIETLEQINFLTQLGCDELQGYLLSKPVDPQSIPNLINQLPIQFTS